MPDEQKRPRYRKTLRIVTFGQIADAERKLGEIVVIGRQHYMVIKLDEKAKQVTLRRIGPME